MRSIEKYVFDLLGLLFPFACCWQDKMKNAGGGEWNV
jgi:hypothetical protein